MKRLAIRTTLATFLTVAIPGAAIAAGDGQRCGLQTLHGRYVFSGSGFTVVGGVTVPKAIIEALVFNGDGTLAVTGGTRSVNGTITTITPVVGTYTVTEDCAGTITLPSLSFDILVSPRGNQYWLIQTIPNNNTFQGSATRTSRDLSDHDQ